MAKADPEKYTNPPRSDSRHPKGIRIYSLENGSKEPGMN